MVLCKYFQQGNCRFGTKCTNEHFDVKQIIKTDVESAINGNQWPLSCFGPFKDKPCIPNFIEDQSFEEIRFLCYESRQKNFFEQFHQQFSKEALEAKNKLKSLLQLTPEVVDLVSKLYDTPTDTTSNPAAVLAAKTNNPFGMTGESGGNSIFGKTAAAPTPAGNVFGGGSAFGAAGTNNAGGLFGNNNSAATAAVGGGGLFGAALGSTFGGVPTQQASMFSQPVKSTNSIFGGGAQQSTIFGQAQQTVPSNACLFGQAANAQQTATAGGLFAQAAQQQQQQQQPALGLFAQAAQQTVPAFGQQSTFGQQQQNAGGMFAQTTQQATGGNLFMQPQQQQQQATGGGIFTAAVGQTQNMFAHQPQQQQPTNIFAQAAQQTQLPPPPPPGTAASGIFQQSTFMQQNQVTAAAPAAAVGLNSTVYSRMEDLTAEEIEAFKADRFTMGKIPFSPPPRETVN